jgi:hypothetical protein
MMLIILIFFYEWIWGKSDAQVDSERNVY